MDYNLLGIGIRIGFPASNSMDYIREQFITSTSNKGATKCGGKYYMTHI